MSDQFLYPPEFLCPITHRKMINPVIAEDKQTYEKEAIENWLRNGHKISPVTGFLFKKKILIENCALKNTIEYFDKYIFPKIQRQKDQIKDLDQELKQIEKKSLYQLEKKEKEYKEKFEKELTKNKNLQNEINELRKRFNKNLDELNEPKKENNQHVEAGSMQKFEIAKKKEKIFDNKLIENIRIYKESTKNHATYDLKKFENIIVEKDIQRFFSLPWKVNIKEEIKSWIKCQNDEIYDLIKSKSFDVVTNESKLKELNQNLKNIKVDWLGLVGHFGHFDFGHFVGHFGHYFVGLVVGLGHFVVGLGVGQLSDSDKNYIRSLKFTFVCPCHNDFLKGIFSEEYNVGFFLFFRT